jgi:hypothetical protein
MEKQTAEILAAYRLKPAPGVCFSQICNSAQKTAQKIKKNQ